MKRRFGCCRRRLWLAPLDPRPRDFVEPYLRQILGFIGVTDVQTVRVEGMNIPELAIGAAPKANKAVAELAL
ncbi:NAD(P)H-dependent oxidoreductase [Rhodoblastus sp. 17X3]|uniref:NAD(P)H-dependent oxidoreductase n=1 Tax=Rhodoblastus sp. 17X3 TaxID=3047026 RepID=UPI0024B7B592|nr:NAD(P)H-dependent oxidoreductase [Rhodoblastus sp. 17X3]MDI9848576.1 NAD(P)H-dependent oxidoreductase [Rhodoblastus sp. 17X3]